MYGKLLERNSHTIEKQTFDIFFDTLCLLLILYTIFTLSYLQFP
jgi:hypothetical protein